MHLLLLPLLFVVIDTDTFTAKVVGVKDGDSIVVLRDKEEVVIRLLDIDCPELSQAFGRQAKKRASDLCFGKTVTLKATGKDRYDRTLAHVILPGGKELNRELVASGLAWWYREESSHLQRESGADGRYIAVCEVETGADAYNNRGNSHLHKAEYDLAIKDYSEATGGG